MLDQKYVMALSGISFQWVNANHGQKNVRSTAGHPSAKKIEAPTSNVLQHRGQLLSVRHWVAPVTSKGHASALLAHGPRISICVGERMKRYQKPNVGLWLDHRTGGWWRAYSHISVFESAGHTVLG